MNVLRRVVLGHKRKRSLQRQRGGRRLRVEQLEDRRLLTADWQNPSGPLDVNGDNAVVALDALIVANELNTPAYATGGGQLPARTDPDAPYFDVDGNNFVTALDALVIINLLNAPGQAFGVSITPGSVAETAGTVAAVGTVTRSGPTATAVTVALASNDTTEISVPANVVIPAGASAATFSIAALDDSLSDGTQSVVVTASASGFTSGQAALEVTDDDQPPLERFFDFGTAASPLSSGFTRVTSTTQYSAATGFGWISGTVLAGDRGTAGSVERDFNYTTDATFVVDLPNGQYRVDTLIGDKVYAHDLVGVYLESNHVGTVTTSGGQVASNRFDVQVTDGQLNLRLADLGGSDANAVIEGLRILAAGVEDPQSNAWWPTRPGIPNATFSERTKSGIYDYFTVDSSYQATTNNIRVLLPAGYDPTKEYPVIYVLPVELGNRTQFGDGMNTIVSHGLQNTTDAIFVSPTFSYHPWYADNAANSSVWQETYFKDVIVPFIEDQYPVIDGPDGRLLLGFSKSGYGAVAMILRNPDYFGRVVAWDSPLAMSNPASGWGFVNVLGSYQNFTDNYQITKLLQSHGHHLKGQPARIFLQGYGYAFTRADHATIHVQMTSLGIPHTYDEGTPRSHVWASGWMPGAVAALMADA